MVSRLQAVTPVLHFSVGTLLTSHILKAAWTDSLDEQHAPLCYVFHRVWQTSIWHTKASFKPGLFFFTLICLLLLLIPFVVYISWSTLHSVYLTVITNKTHMLLYCNQKCCISVILTRHLFHCSRTCGCAAPTGACV